MARRKTVDNKAINSATRKKVTLALKSIYNFSFAVESDDELKEAESSRGLTDEEKQQPPSDLISQIDRGFSALANLLTDGDDDA
jgi:hypothetical protein